MCHFLFPLNVYNVHIIFFFNIWKALSANQIFLSNNKTRIQNLGRYLLRQILVEVINSDGLHRSGSDVISVFLQGVHGLEKRLHPGVDVVELLSSAEVVHPHDSLVFRHYEGSASLHLCLKFADWFPHQSLLWIN